MRRIRHILFKELAQLRRDRRMIPILFIAPVVQLIILGYAANVDVKLIDTAVCDYDHSPRSRELLRGISASGYFDIVAYTSVDSEMTRFLDDGIAKMGVVIPRGFGESLRKGEKGRVQVLADGSDSNAAVIGLGYMGIALRKYSNDIVQEKLLWQGLRRPPAATVIPETRVWYNPELKSAFFMIPGVLGLLLMVTTMMTTSMGIVREKEIGTLEQLIVTPIRSYELILGKLLPFVLVGFIEVSVVLTAATLIFHIPIRSGILLVYFFCGLFLLTTLGLGLFVSTISHTQQQAMMTSGFFVMMPFMMLSGFVFPIENMPDVIQAVTYLIPLRYFFVIIRALFLKGVGLAALWREALALFVWGVGILGLSILRFRRSL
jgi:ABC-2 type transport system permease protein